MPGANAYTQNLLRGYKGLAAINQNTTEFWDLYHSIQTTFQRRFQNGFSFGANYTLGLVLDGNTGLTAALPARGRRHDLGALGSGAVPRSCSSS